MAAAAAAAAQSAAESAAAAAESAAESAAAAAESAAAAAESAAESAAAAAEAAAAAAAEAEEEEAEEEEEEAKGAAAARSSDPPSFDEKLFQVTLWLRQLYQNVPIPWYEVNETTVDILYEVMECSKEREKDVMLLIEDMKDRAAKYEAQVDYWQDILEEVLGFYSLSKEAQTDLIDLVESALELEVEDTSLTSFYSAITCMTSELHKTESKNNEMELQLKTLTKKLNLALTMEKKLKEDVEKLQESQEAEKARMEIRSKNLKFLQAKTEDLKIKIKEAENKLLDVGLDQSLTHEALMKSSEELAALYKGMEPLKKELKSYNDLPLSMPLAQVMVEEARNELKALDDELTRELEAVPFELT